MIRQLPINGSYRVVKRFAVFPRSTVDLGQTAEIYLQSYYHVQHYNFRIGWIDSYCVTGGYDWADFSTSEAAEEFRRTRETEDLTTLRRMNHGS